MPNTILCNLQPLPTLKTGQVTLRKKQKNIINGESRIVDQIFKCILILQAFSKAAAPAAAEPEKKKVSQKKLKRQKLQMDRSEGAM